MIVRELITRMGFGLDQASVNRVEQATNRVKDRAEQAAQAFRNVVTSLVAFGTVQSVIRIADEMQSLRTRIGMLPQTVGEASAAFDEVAKHADAMGQSITAYGTLYNRLGNAAKDYITTQKDLLGITDTISQALVVGGANAQEASSVMIQFAQALGSGVLQGDEFRAMAEAAPQYLDKLSEAMGIPREQLKKMASEGKLTTKAVIEATRQMSGYFEDKFKQMPLTVGRATTMVANRFSAMIDKMNRDSGFVETIAKSILYALDKIEAGINVVIDAAGGWNNVMRILGITIGVALGAKTLSILAAFWNASVLAMLPFIKMVAIIAAVALVLEDLYLWIQGGESLTGALLGPWEQWRPYVMGAIEMVTDALRWFGKVLAAVNAILVGAFTLDPYLFKVGLEELGSLLWQKLGEWGQAIYNAFFDPIVRAFKDAWNAVTSFGSSIVQSVVGAVTAPDAGLGGTGLGSPLAGRVTMAQMSAGGMGAQRPSIQNNTTVSLTVPPGTPQEQQTFLQTAAQKSFDKESNAKLARDLATYAP